jgi:hypothetical protein
MNEWMAMPFLRTYEATDWPEKRSLRLRIVSLLLFFLPQSNRGYKGRWHLIRQWLVEFDESGVPWREIGLGADDLPVVSGPDDESLGFWTESNVRWGDIVGEEIEREEFERHWLRAAPLRKGDAAAANGPDG